MKIFFSIIIATFLFAWHAPASAYYEWYDDKGHVHYTQDSPPLDAKNKDGTSWWDSETVQEEETERTNEAGYGYQPQVEENDPQKSWMLEPEDREDADFTDATGKKENEDNENKGFFKRLTNIFSDDEKEEDCVVPWLVEKYGICPVGDDEPSMEKIGNTFKAVVVDKRKGVWSSCRGTYNGDMITFTYKGQKYWETDGNVPECSFYEGFKWE